MCKCTQRLHSTDFGCLFFWFSDDPVGLGSETLVQAAVSGQYSPDVSLTCRLHLGNPHPGGVNSVPHFCKTGTANNLAHVDLGAAAMFSSHAHIL